VASEADLWTLTAIAWLLRADQVELMTVSDWPFWSEVKGY